MDFCLDMVTRFAQAQKVSPGVIQKDVDDAQTWAIEILSKGIQDGPIVSAILRMGTGSQSSVLEFIQENRTYQL